MQILAIVAIIAIIMASKSNSAAKIIIATMASKMIIKTITGITATAWAISTNIAYFIKKV